MKGNPRSYARQSDRARPSTNGPKKHQQVGLSEDAKDQVEVLLFLWPTEADASAAAKTEGLLLRCDPYGSSEWKDAVRGEQVVIVTSTTEEGIAVGRAKASECLGNGASKTYVWPLPEYATEPGRDLKAWMKDYDLAKTLEHQCSPRLGWAQYEYQETKETSKDPEEKQPQILLRLASVATLFHDGERRAYAVVPVNGHQEVHPVCSHAFRLWLKHRFFAEQARPPSSQAFQDALGVIESRAVFDGQKQSVHVRVAGDADRIFIDIGEDNWRVVEITAEGWKFRSDPPVRFRRTSGQLPLAEPLRGGSITELKEFINCDDDDFVLVVAWLAAALRPMGPYPLLPLTGEQGSAKSTLARALRRLVDNHVSPIRAAPETARDLAVSASNGHVFVLDNLSSIPPWLSDALCRLATGGGLANRTHYTMDEETYLEAQRPIILTGIEDIISRGDLIDRSLPIHLPAIPPGKRCTEKQFWAKFDAASPRLVGSLFDLMARALAILPQVEIAVLPRMADFALFGEAVSRAMGNAPGVFEAAYEGARETANKSAVEDSPVAGAIQQLVPAEGDSWRGGSKELLERLEKLASEKDMNSRSWPRGSRGMSGSLRRLAPQLRLVGIQVVWERRKNDSRPVVITRTAPEANSVPF